MRHHRSWEPGGGDDLVGSPSHQPPDLRIFICYRRDTAAYAGRVYDTLVRRYGADNVFLDIDAIPPGSDFTQALDAALLDCHVVLTVIGRSWLTVVGPQGLPRLEDPEDFVRRELETALHRQLVIIPLLVQNATMPTRKQLPSVLGPLATRQAVELPDRWWNDGMHVLLNELDRLWRKLSARRLPLDPLLADAHTTPPELSAPRNASREPPATTTASKADHPPVTSPPLRATPATAPNSDDAAVPDAPTAMGTTDITPGTEPTDRRGTAGTLDAETLTALTGNGSMTKPPPPSPPIRPAHQATSTRRWALTLGIAAALIATILVIDRSSNTPTAPTTSAPAVPASVATVAVGQQPQGVALSPDGHRLWVANSGSGTISVLDTGSDAVMATLPVAASPVNIAFTPDGRHAYVTDYKSATVVILDAITGKIVGQPIRVQDGPWGVALTPDGRRAYITNCGASTVSVIDTAAASVLGPPISVGTCPLGVAASPNGRRIFVANAYSNSISIIDTTTNAVTGAPIAVGARPHSLVLSADGRRGYVANNGELYTSGPGPGTISVIDTESDTTIGAPIPVGNGPWGLALSPDGSRLFTGDSASGAMTAIDIATSTVIRPTVTVEKVPEGVAVSASGRQVYVANSGSASISAIHF